MSKWQTMQNSEEIVRYELSHLNLNCLQTPLIAFGSESVNTLETIVAMFDVKYGQK